jgi:hypothetical protein
MVKADHLLKCRHISTGLQSVIAQETATRWRQKKKTICKTLNEKNILYHHVYVYVVFIRCDLDGEKLWDFCWNVSEGKKYENRVLCQNLRDWLQRSSLITSPRKFSHVSQVVT